MGVFERKRNKNWTQSVFVILQLHCELLYPQAHRIMKDQPIWVLTRANSANVNTPSGAKHMWISFSCHSMQSCGGLEAKGKNKKFLKFSLFKCWLHLGFLKTAANANGW